MKRKNSFRKPQETITRKLNFGNDLRKACAVTLGIVGVKTFIDLGASRSEAQILHGIGVIIGGGLGGVALGVAGTKMRNKALRQLIGKPLICKKISSGIKNSITRMEVRTLGHVNWKNRDIRDAFERVFVTKTARIVDVNRVAREMMRAKKLELIIKEDFSLPRNPIIAKIFRYINLSENIGSGFHKMIYGWEKNYHQKPIITGDFDYYTITFPLTTSKTTTKTTSKTTINKEHEIIEIINNNPHLNAKDIAKAVDLTIDGVRYHINNLTKKGIIKREGSSKKGKWEVIK